MFPSTEYGIDDNMAAYMTYPLDMGFSKFDEGMRQTPTAALYNQNMIALAQGLDAILATFKMDILQLYRAIAIKFETFQNCILFC